MKFKHEQSFLSEEIKEVIPGGTGNSTIVIDKQEIKTNLPPTEKIIIPDDVPPVILPVAETEVEKQARIDLEEQNKLNNTKPVVQQIQNADGTIGDYIMDDNGNATKDGVIIYTADQLEGTENEPDDKPEDVKEDIHQLISEVSGLNLVDDNNQPLVFKEGVEGLAQREIAVKDLFYQKGKDEALTEIFTKNPDLYEMYNYKSKHGSLDNFARQTNYKTLELSDETTTDELKSIMKEYLTAVGNDEKYAERFIKLSEQDETLRVDALDALTKLKEMQTQKEANIKQQTIQQEATAIAEVEQYYGVYYDKQGKLIDKNVEGSLYDKIVKQGKIGNIMIPNAGLIVNQNGKQKNITRSQIFNYFYEPVVESNGNYLSQAQIDEQSRMSSTDNFLIQGIRNLAGGDISSLEKAMQNIIRVKDAKKIIRVASSTSKVINTPSQSDIDKQLQKGTAQIIIQ